jgi:hypothetical protein
MRGSDEALLNGTDVFTPYGPATDGTNDNTMIIGGTITVDSEPSNFLVGTIEAIAFWSSVITESQAAAVNAALGAI